MDRCVYYRCQISDVAHSRLGWKRCRCSCAAFDSFCFFNHLLSSFLDAVKGPNAWNCSDVNLVSASGPGFFIYFFSCWAPRRARRPKRNRMDGGFPPFLFSRFVGNFILFPPILWLVYKDLKGLIGGRPQLVNVFIRSVTLRAPFSNKNTGSMVAARLEFPLLSIRSLLPNFRFGPNPRNSMNLVVRPPRRIESIGAVRCLWDICQPFWGSGIFMTWWGGGGLSKKENDETPSSCVFSVVGLLETFIDSRFLLFSLWSGHISNFVSQLIPFFILVAEWK